MDTSKWIGRSKTAWGILIMIASSAAPALAPWFGFTVEAGDIGALGAAGTDLLQAAGNFFGAALAIYGRFKAVAAVTLAPGSGQ
jgi:hypothetical protein